MKFQPFQGNLRNSFVKTESKHFEAIRALIDNCRPLLLLSKTKAEDVKPHLAYLLELPQIIKIS